MHLKSWFTQWHLLINRLDKIMCKWVQIGSLHTQHKLEFQFCSVTLPLHYYFCAAFRWVLLLQIQQGLDLVQRKFPTTCIVTTKNKTWTAEHSFLAGLLTLDICKTLHRNKHEKNTMPMWPLHLKLITKPLAVLYTRCFTARIHIPEVQGHFSVPTRVTQVM